MAYKGEVTINTTYNECYGTSEEEFKSRYNNHTQSFRRISHINDTELSKHLWTLKVNGTDYHLKQSIKSYASRYQCGTGRCDLCDRKNDFGSSRPKSSVEYQTDVIGISLF